LSGSGGYNNYILKLKKRNDFMPYLTDKAEIKTVILSIYDAVAVEVPETEIRESIVSTGAVSPFDYEENFRELAEEGMLKLCRFDERDCCVITEYGAEAFEQARL